MNLEPVPPEILFTKCFLCMKYHKIIQMFTKVINKY